MKINTKALTFQYRVCDLTTKINRRTGTSGLWALPIERIDPCPKLLSKCVCVCVCVCDRGGAWAGTGPPAGRSVLEQ